MQKLFRHLLTFLTVGWLYQNFIARQAYVASFFIVLQQCRCILMQQPYQPFVENLPTATLLRRDSESPNFP